MYPSNLMIGAASCFRRSANARVAILFSFFLTVLGAVLLTGCESPSIRGPAGTPPDSAMPKFPWPPPRYSAFSPIPQVFVAPTTQPSMGEVAGRIERAFDTAGYSERSFYWIPGGFALVSRIEQIRADASPMAAGRWAVTMPPPHSFNDYIKALFSAPPGYYRVIVFVVTDQSFSATNREPSRDEAADWLSRGAIRLPSELAARPYTSEHYTAALIYEFERKRDDPQALVKAPSDFLGRTHLEKAGLWSALQSR
jgi:hypothetical protein